MRGSRLRRHRLTALPHGLASIWGGGDLGLCGVAKRPRIPEGSLPVSGGAPAQDCVSQPQTLLSPYFLPLPLMPVPGQPSGLRAWGMTGQGRGQRPVLIAKLKAMPTWAGEKKSRRLIKTTPPLQV